MEITNVSGQTLVFPDGTEVKRGERYTLTEADMKNVAVSEWLKDGWFGEASESGTDAEADDLAKAKAEAAAKADIKKAKAEG